MKKITSYMWDKIEYNLVNSYKKIGFYDDENNRFFEVARWRNTYNKASGANYGMLNLWTPLYNAHFFESQGGRNTCGGYNKPIANLEGVLYQYKKALDNHELVNDCGEFVCSDCGSIDSLISELVNFLQKMYIKKLFVIDIF